MLKHFARLIQDGIRKIDTAGRLGGEEFAIILPGAENSVAASASAERLREIVATIPFVQNGKTIPITVSIGVATIGSGDCNEGATLIREIMPSIARNEMEEIGLRLLKPNTQFDCGRS